METTEKETEKVAGSIDTGVDAQASIEKDRQMKRFHRTVKMNRKSMILFIAVVVVCGLLYSIRGLLVAVTVNGSPIARWTIIRELENKSGEQALDAFVTKKLIAAAAKKSGVVVSQSDVDAEVANITEQVTKQGGTLALALEQQGMTEKEFRDQIVLQKELEAILGDAVVVTDEDVSQYMAQTKGAAPKGMSDDDFKMQVREQLKGQKFNMAASKWVTDEKAKSQITYFVDYAPKALPISEEADSAPMSIESK